MTSQDRFENNMKVNNILATDRLVCNKLTARNVNTDALVLSTLSGGVLTAENVTVDSLRIGEGNVSRLNAEKVSAQGASFREFSTMTAFTPNDNVTVSVNSAIRFGQIAYLSIQYVLNTAPLATGETLVIGTLNPDLMPTASATQGFLRDVAPSFVGLLRISTDLQLVLQNPTPFPIEPGYPLGFSYVFNLG